MKFIATSKEGVFAAVKSHCEQRAEELKAARKKEILYFTFYMGEEPVADQPDSIEYDFALVFMDEPNRAAKMGAMDLIFVAQSTRSAENIWLACKIPGEFDERVEKDDDVYIGLMSEIIDTIRYKVSALKKNTMS
jgi:hypothetical protein